MQIHEVTTTTRKIPILNEDLIDKIWAYYDQWEDKDPALAGLDIKQKTARFAQDRMVRELADNAWSIWQVYNNKWIQTLPAAERAAYIDRSDGTYEKNLLAFVQKNLLPGKYLSQLTNGAAIIALIKEISAPMAPPPGTPPPPAGSPPAGTNTPEQQKLDFERLVATTALSMKAGDTGDTTEKQLAAIGKEIITPGVVATGTKTGNPVMDKALTDLGFTLT